MSKFLFDTNALIRQPYLLDLEGDIIIPYIVLQELDKLKIGTSDTAYKARLAVRKLKEKNVKYVPEYDNKHPLYTSKVYNADDLIIECAKENKATLVTGDFLAQLKAKSYDIEVYEVEDDHIDNDYTGIKELFVDTTSQIDNEFLASIYENDNSHLNLLTNQYLIVWDKTKPAYDNDGKIKGYHAIDKFKFTGDKIIKLKYKNIDSMFSGKIKPLNVKQELMFDLLQDKSTTVKAAFGSFGVGKDYLMISHAVELLQHQKIDKIIWVRNNVEVKDSNPIGFLPSDMESKLLPFAMPLADHLGGLDGLDAFLRQGKIEIQHLGFMRGRDIKNSLIYVTECENNTREHVQLLLSRVGTNSQLWMNGDTRQIDHDKFSLNNGVNSLKKLKGQELYGQVTLDKTERSETSRLADLLD